MDESSTFMSNSDILNCSVNGIPNENCFLSPPPVSIATDELDLLQYAASPVPILLNNDPWRVLCEQIFFYGLPMIVVSGFIFTFSAVMALSRQLESSTEVYLFTLALSNWLLLVVSGVLHIENYTGRQNIFQLVQLYCRALHEWLWYVSCWMVIVMTIECLVTVCQKRLTSLCSKSQALVLTILVYATCMISVLPEFWAYEIKELLDTNTNSTIYRLAKTPTMRSMEYNVMYYWYRQSITFLIPYPLLLIAAGVILKNGGTRCRVVTTTIPAANAQMNAKGTGILISSNGVSPSPRLGKSQLQPSGNGMNHSSKKPLIPQPNCNNLLVTIRQPEAEVQLNRSVIAVSLSYSVLTLPHVTTQFLLRNFATAFKDDEGDVNAPIALMQGSQMIFKLFFYAQFGMLFLLLVCHMERFRQSLARVCCSCCLGEDAFDDYAYNAEDTTVQPVARLDLTENNNLNGFSKTTADIESNGMANQHHSHHMNGNGTLNYGQLPIDQNAYESNTMNGIQKQSKPLKPIIKRTSQMRPSNEKPPAYQEDNGTNDLVVMQSTV